ncbi:4Fe-4S dicluster domain-containing protein [Desulfomicrobium salsuginis]
MTHAAPTKDLHELASRISAECTECRACQFRCTFLSEHGTPKTLADRFLTTGTGRAAAFECSLCGLCSTVCPMGLPLKAFFLAMRRAAMDAGRISLVPYRARLDYERFGASQLMSLFRLPAGGDTVFFPGCTLPGRHPDTTRALLAHLRNCIPDLGLVLSCCFKTTHDLGCQDRFDVRFGALLDRLHAMGVTTVLTACPNCFAVFTEYGRELTVRTVFDVLAEHPVTRDASVRGAAVVHTPCPYRGDAHIQERIRLMVEDTGLDPEKTRQDGPLSPCCGEGGSVGLLRPELAAAWGAKAVRRADGRVVVTSCAGCVAFLSGHARAVHLLDLVFHPARTMSGTLPRPKGLATYLHRLRLKWRALAHIR